VERKRKMLVLSSFLFLCWSNHYLYVIPPNLIRGRRGIAPNLHRPNKIQVNIKLLKYFLYSLIETLHYKKSEPSEVVQAFREHTHTERER
jgi:hypothetical protein